jgi:hypothetical protein
VLRAPRDVRRAGSLRQDRRSKGLAGVKNIAVLAAYLPRLFQWDDRQIEWRPRLLVGADGRSSSVRRQLPFDWKSDAPHNYLRGILVDGVPQWPVDTFSMVPRRPPVLCLSAGRWEASPLRLLGVGRPKRFSGPERQRNVLEAFGKLTCLRHSDAIAASKPIGPFNAFPNEDQWTDDPTLPGMVLIGDAAGYNDPIGGQGLAIALRDVRVVRDLLLGGDVTPKRCSLMCRNGQSVCGACESRDGSSPLFAQSLVMEPRPAAHARSSARSAMVGHRPSFRQLLARRSCQLRPLRKLRLIVY